ncbi:MAG: hypothetical protein ABIF08_01355 [Nanoarchaeota archaeon]
MSTALPWVFIGVLAGLIITLGLVLFLFKRKKGVAGQDPDYRSFFLIGLSWLIIGIPFIFIYDMAFNGLFIMGLIFFIMGAANFKKWNKKPITKNQKIGWALTFIAMIILLAFVWFVNILNQ